MKTLIVDRKKWFRGTRMSDSALCTDTGSKCCLGFAMNQLCGVPYTYLNEERYNLPSEVAYENMDIEWKRRLESIEDKAVEINDSGDVVGKAREKELIELFKNIDVKLVFKN